MAAMVSTWCPWHSTCDPPHRVLRRYFAPSTRQRRGIEQGFPSQAWCTFRQALSVGCNVRKDEHGTTVVYADRFIPDDEKKRARETGEEAQAVTFLKRFTVFNTAQCEGLPDDIAVAAPPSPSSLTEPPVEALILATGTISASGWRCCARTIAPSSVPPRRRVSRGLHPRLPGQRHPAEPCRQCKEAQHPGLEVRQRRRVSVKRGNNAAVHFKHKRHSGFLDKTARLLAKVKLRRHRWLFK